MQESAASLLDFQTMLASALGHVVALSIVLIGLGLAISGAAPAAGYRVKRLGLQIIAACLIVVIAHVLMIEFYGADVPVAVLVGTYGLVSLLLLQGFLNLVFGPAVGNRVVANLLGTLLSLVLQPIRLLRGLFR